MGKSSLLNLLVGRKIAIISDKPQTTRTRITGVLTQDEVQLVFIDTPGTAQTKEQAGRLHGQAGDRFGGRRGLCCFVADPFGDITESELALIENIKELHLPAILVINKIDALANKEDMVKKWLPSPSCMTLSRWFLSVSVRRTDRSAAFADSAAGTGRTTLFPK